MLESATRPSPSGDGTTVLNEARLEQLYREHGRRLLAIAAAIVPRDEAVEVLHDAFMTWWRTPQLYDPVRGSIAAWLAVIVRRKALDRRRAATRRVAREHRSFEERAIDPQDEFVEHDVVEIAHLQRSMDALPAEQRQALQRAYFGGQTHVEIAASLGLPLGTVKKRIALAMRRLRRDFVEGDDRASG
ncbi:sigma-70 family RNA polymerase sigma factor [bacterium]|nr:MAG: sigma-70 family RNA polymerase sigma factor [bacterium]